jgi:ribonuclease-3
VKTTDELEAALGYTFRDRDLLARALTHRSHLNEPKRGGQDDNERLEFLGDAVLNLAVSEALIDRRPEATEGALSKWRARLVSEPTLARVAGRLGVGQWLRLGRGEELSGGREKRSLLADGFEALIGAVYLDGGRDGYDAARRCVLAALEPELDESPDAESGLDYKTHVQEYCQQRFGVLPVYRVHRESGPDHQKVFHVELTIDGRSSGDGTGHTKKEAEQQAARAAWQRLRAADEDHGASG